MDLGHLIKVSSVDEVLVHWPWNEAPWKSRLSLSVHHLILTPHQQCSRTKPKEVIQVSCYTYHLYILGVVTRSLGGLQGHSINIQKIRSNFRGRRKHADSQMKC